MSSFNTLTATTEFDAVNQLLSEIGRAPLDDPSDVDTSTDTEVVLAKNAIKETLREVLAEGYRFNTEFGYEVAPESPTFDWVDTAGVTTALNIFLAPARLLSFEVADAPTQQGCAKPDVVLKKSKEYTVGTPPDDVAVVVFYDRAKNRDGLDSTVYPFLYIDAAFFMDFDEIPDVARTYITTRAARKFVRRVVGSDTLMRLSEQDELMAFRKLKRSEGLVEAYNLKQNSLFGFLDLHRNPRSGVYDRRASAGPA